MCTSVINNYFMGNMGFRGGRGRVGGCGRRMGMPSIFDSCHHHHRKSTKAENTTSIFNGIIGILGTVLNPMSAFTGSMLS